MNGLAIRLTVDFPTETVGNKIQGKIPTNLGFCPMKLPRDAIEMINMRTKLNKCSLSIKIISCSVFIHIYVIEVCNNSCM